ncbi:uncharacterized protein TNCV_2616831 [Trichonephila clavipes]|nr:uncharacterized protein TNCV_2616831 [Trichonephila clavipes]
MMSRSCGSNKTAQHATIDLLKDTFGNRLISRFGPVNWPPRSWDLTPLNYFLWGYVKSLVYADKPQTLDHLEHNIRRVIAYIRPQMLEKVIENWTSRLYYIRASRGSPMPEIIFKINEQADPLADEGYNASPPISSTLTYSEHLSRVKSEILRSGGPRPTITGMKANMEDPYSYLNVAEPLRLQSLDLNVTT